MDNNNINNNIEDDDEDTATVTLELDNGVTVECAVLTIFPVGKNDYIALLPLEGETDDEGEIYLYKYLESPDGEPSLDNIIDDDEYEAVADAFDELLDSLEYDEIITDENLD